MDKPVRPLNAGSNSDQPSAISGHAASAAPDNSANQPSFPLSMTVRPHTADSSSTSQPLLPSGNSTDEFEQLRARLGGPAENLDKRKVGFDGFRLRAHESKLERDRRYGSVYTVTEFQNGYLVRLEMPRSIPRSSLGAAWGLADAKPEYRCSIACSNDSLIISASLADEKMRRVAYISRSFPADFQTRIRLGAPVSSFAYRLCDDNLEIAVLHKSTESTNDTVADEFALRD